MLYRLRLSSWMLLLTGFTYGVSERTLTFFNDGVLSGVELGQYLVIVLALICLSTLYPQEG